MPRRKINFRDTTYAGGFVARLKQLIKEAGGVGQLAEKCHTAPGKLYHYLKNDGEPSYAVLADIAQGTGKSLDWLMLGREPDLTPMPMADPPGPARTDDGFWKNFRQIPEYIYDKDKPWIQVPRAPGKTSVVAFDQTWLQNEFKDDFAFLTYLIAFDREMEPTIRLGEIMLLLPMPEQIRQFGKRDGIYLIWWDGILAVRKIQFEGKRRVKVMTPDPDNQWRARYYSPNLPEITEKGELGFIARIVWSGHLQ